MSELSRNFGEYVAEGTLQKERYPYYIDLRVPTGDHDVRDSFLTQLANGLVGVDHQFFADVGGRVRYRFRTEADRDLLCRVRNEPDFGNKVRLGLAPPCFARGR